MTGRKRGLPRVVIITPGQIGSNPRVVKDAQALHDTRQVDVTVIATKVTEEVEPRDQSILNVAPYQVIRLEFDSRSKRIVGRFRMELARAAFRMTGARAKADLAASTVTGRLTAAASATPADLYIAHYVAALPAAARAAKRHGALYAFDAEDYHLGDLPDHFEHERQKRIIRAIEERYLPGAAFVTAASPMIAQAYTATYGIPLPTTILNVFLKRNAPPAPTPCGTAEPGPSLYWFSQTLGPGRGLETAIKAIGRAESRPHLYLRGMPDHGYVQRLQDLARQFGVCDRLHLLAQAMPDDLERLGSTYDLGYIGELAETQNRQIALTNKLFSYLMGGVPILASDIPAHRGIAPELGPAMSMFPGGDAGALAAALDAYLLDRDRLATARAHAWRLGQERFNWDCERKRFVSLAKKIINGAHEE